MTLDDISNQIAQIANSRDPIFADAATYLGQAVQTARDGQMSKEELAEILKDFQRQLEITQEMSDLGFKETLNTCINGLMTIISAI
jgi:alcohol dehydrogenase class IV